MRVFDLPDEVLFDIICLLPLRDALQLRLTCSEAADLFLDHYLWAQFGALHFPLLRGPAVRDESSYRRVYATQKAWDRGDARYHPLVTGGSGAGSAVFSLIPWGADALLTGGTRGVSVWRPSSRERAFSLRGTSGLALAVAPGVILGSAFDGITRVWQGWDEALRDGEPRERVRAFLMKQRPRYIRRLLQNSVSAVEKSELVDAVLDEAPLESLVLPPTLELPVVGAHQAAVDVLLEETSFMLAKQSGTVDRIDWSGKLLGSFQAHQVATNCIRREADWYFTAGSDSMVCQWDAESGAAVNSGACGQHWIWTLDLEPQGTRFAASGVDGCCRVFDRNTWRPTKILPHGAEISGLQVDWEKHRLVTACFDGLVRVYDLRGGPTPVYTLLGDQERGRLSRVAITEEWMAVGTIESGTAGLFSFAPG